MGKKASEAYKITTVLFFFFSQLCYSQQTQSNKSIDTPLNLIDSSAKLSDLADKRTEQKSQEIVKESETTDATPALSNSTKVSGEDKSSSQSTDSSSGQNSISSASTTPNLPKQSPAPIPNGQVKSIEPKTFVTSLSSGNYNLYILFGLSYVAIIAVLRYSTKNPKAAIFILKIMYFVFGLPFIAIAYLLRSSLKQSDASTSKGNRGGSPPSIVFDDPHVVTSSIKSSGNLSWAVRYGHRSHPSAHEMAITSSTHGGNLSVYYDGKAHNIRYTVHW